MAEIPNDIPGNSKRQQNQQAEAQRGDKPPVPVFEGPSAGVKRKQQGAFISWFKRMFFSDRKLKDILLEVVEQRIVPGIKDNVRNSAMATIDSIFYPGTGSAPVSVQNGITMTAYNKVYNSQQPRSTPPPSQTQTQQMGSNDINSGFSNPCFKYRRVTTLPDGTKAQGAEEFLAMLKSYDYPTLDVHTLYLMQGKHIDFTWTAYGWNREEIQALSPGCIRPTGNTEWPFMIVLPEAHLIS